MMKRLNAVGEAAWNGTVVLLRGASWLLAGAAFILFWGFVAYWVYLAVQWLGFGDKAAYWSALISIGVVGLFFSSHDRKTLALKLTAWMLIAVAILAIGFVILAVIITPPSLYSLVVIGLVLLAGIFWQLTKLTSKR